MIPPAPIRRPLPAPWHAVRASAPLGVHALPPEAQCRRAWTAFRPRRSVLVFIRLLRRRDSVKLKRIPRRKLKVMTGMFFGAGSLGILAGLGSGGGFTMTAFGTALVCIGGLTGWMLLTQDPMSARDRRKKRRRGEGRP